MQQVGDRVPGGRVWKTAEMNMPHYALTMFSCATPDFTGSSGGEVLTDEQVGAYRALMSLPIPAQLTRILAGLESRRVGVWDTEGQLMLARYSIALRDAGCTTSDDAPA